MEHTKGPWRVVSEDPNWDDYPETKNHPLHVESTALPIGALVASVYDRRMAQTPLPTGFEGELAEPWTLTETVANARLIAAAPDLLAALNNILLNVERNQQIDLFYRGVISTICRTAIRAATSAPAPHVPYPGPIGDLWGTDRFTAADADPDPNEPDPGESARKGEEG